jgi:hypothetical protein
VDDELGDDGEAGDPDVEKDVPEVVLKGARIFQPEDEEVPSYVDAGQ